MGKTMFDKIWDAHVVRQKPGESTVLYIDRHLVHEATSPQAFAGLKAAGRPVRQTHTRPSRCWIIMCRRRWDDVCWMWLIRPAKSVL